MRLCKVHIGASSALMSLMTVGETGERKKEGVDSGLYSRV